MTLGLIFWVMMLLWLLFGLWATWQPVPGNWGIWGHGLFLFILFLLLGWKVFGAPIRDARACSMDASCGIHLATVVDRQW